ncbi:MAG: DUF1569 domain-containing protein [Saprospiraceae bacterium]|jgi:hypothetical protein|nr:DUF1569 domain-containing protein [Saprospiraceae bacterium]
MPIPNIFSSEVTEQFISRIQKIQDTTNPQWGKMNAAQMIAHCCVTYELVYENIHPKPGLLMQLLLKTIVKKTVTGTVPYKKNLKTSPAFLKTGEYNLALEKTRLINYLRRTQELGESYFDGKESHSFGKLNSNEWNNMFAKHLDHHLTQFGV